MINPNIDNDAITQAQKQINEGNEVNMDKILSAFKLSNFEL